MARVVAGRCRDAGVGKLRAVLGELNLSRCDYDPVEACRCYRLWQARRGRDALLEIYGPYLPHQVESLERLFAKEREDPTGAIQDDIARVARLLAFVVGPQRHKMCAGITAKSCCVSE
jgi:hypothetical protein